MLENSTYIIKDILKLIEIRLIDFYLKKKLANLSNPRIAYNLKAALG
jgi:hypothetical protein